MNTKEIPSWLLGVVTSVFGAFTAHSHPDWGPWIIGLVGCLTHHTGKAAAKASNGTTT